MSFSGNVDVTIRLLLILLLLVMSAVVTALAGPGVQGWLFPIISYTERAGIRRDGNKVCWTTIMEKGREGFPETTAYFVNYDLAVPATDSLPARTVRVRSTINVYLASNGVPLSVPGFAYHPPHVRWTTAYCTTDIPAAAIGKPLEIDGTLYYRTGNPLWLVPQPLPSVHVD